MKSLYIYALISAMACTAQGASVPQFLDHDEYNLVGRIQIERDPEQRLVLLERWSQQYPHSEFRQERWNQLITTYRALGRPRKMREVARSMAADNPSGFGNYWLTVLTVNLQDTNPQALDEGRRAAHAVLRNAGVSFAAVNRPAAVSQSDWYRERDRQIGLAHRTLGWIELQEKHYREAAAELAKVIGSNPSDAEACFWMGSALTGRQDPALQSKALYYFARSLAVTGKNALMPEARRLVQPYFEHAYVAVKGSPNGMPEFIQQAAADLKRK